jgi:hypothetical protein
LRIIERGDSGHDIDSGVGVDDIHVDHLDVDDNHRLRRTTDSGPR